MSIIKKEFYGVVCDNCQEQYINANDQDYFEYDFDANSNADDDGWVISALGDYCEKCKDNQF